MKDATGRELQIGDKVAYIVTSPWAGMRLESIEQGEVERFTPKMVVLKNTTRNHAGWWARQKGFKTYRTIKTPHRCIKIS